MAKRDELMDYVRIRVQIDVNSAIRRGNYLRLGDGSKKWVAFTYEKMPLYCYLCGLVGHMEKRCPNATWIISSTHEQNFHMENG